MKNVEQLTVNTIRVLSAEAIQKAKSGHPGTPLGAAPMAYTLWARNMKHNPKNPNWVDRDRFVLSAGHGSMLIYSLLHLFGYGLPMEEIKNFRQWGSKAAGHPEYGHTVGVETTTGPLGHGLATAVGMAVAEAHLAAKFNKPGMNVVDHYTYVLSGDGCLMEGVASEACSMAGTLGLGKLILLYDSNDITIEGNTNIAFREDVGKRYEAYGWQVLKVQDGTDLDAIDKAIEAAKAEKSKPSIIIIRTQIGYGCPAKQGKPSAHGEPLGEDNIKCMKETLGWKYEEPFTVPQEVKTYLDGVVNEKAKAEDAWNKLWSEYSKQYPELAKEWEAWHSGKVNVDLLNDESFWSFEEKPNATRNCSNEVINRLAKVVPNLIGGSADLAPANKTNMKERGDFSAEDYSGSNMHFGVREHAMGAIANGIAVHGGLMPFVATFFVFSDFAKPSMRLAALMNLPVIYVMTHDSIGVGEDGPTHQPIEQLPALRSMPNVTVIRPADAKETAAAWYAAMTRRNGPTALLFTRQNLPFYKETGKDALKGAYILSDSEKATPDMILIGTGSEVEQVYEAKKVLKEKGVDARVVSMPSWEIFEEQTAEYKESVLPSGVKARLAVEAASTFGWHKYVGTDGDIIGIDTFGASAPYKVMFEKYGFTVQNVVDRALKLLKK